MAQSKAFMLPKLTSVFLSAPYLDKESELLLPIKKNVPLCCLWPSSALVNHRGGIKSRTPNRFCCPETESDGLALMSGKHEACTSKGTLLSLNKRSVLREAAVASKSMESKSDTPPCAGLGIVDFLKDKNLLITGATGFLAKVLIEKILRMQPDVGKLFLIIRANESTTALKRLNNEVLNTELFNGLREIHGNEFQEFMLKRLVPLAGDMTKQNLGIEKDMVGVLTKEVDIIVSSAATTTFDERARSYGWQDTYAFSKAMGEMIIVNGSEDLPVVILRPTIIESTCSQPFSGWIEGHRMIDPVITYHGKGHLSCLLGDPDTVIDLIPADMVVNATLAAMAKHAGKRGVKVYQVASSVANPLTLRETFKIIFEHFKCNPYIDHNGKPVRLLKEMTWIKTMENYRQALDTAFDSPSGINGLSTEHILEQLKYMAKIHEPYSFCKARFDISNSEKLSEELSPEERESFGFDVKNIKWKNYIGNIHVPGLRKHVWKGRGTGKQITNI